MHKPLTVSEKQRLAELVEAGTPFAEICEVIGFALQQTIDGIADR